MNGVNKAAVTRAQSFSEEVANSVCHGLGLVGALVGTRMLESLLFGVGTLDTATLAATSVLMLAVGAVASWIPAYRASAVDPVETLAES